MPRHHLFFSFIRIREKKIFHNPPPSTLIMSTTLKSNGRVSGSGLRKTDDGTFVPHRCEQVLVSRTLNGNYKIEDPHREFCIESLDLNNLKGLGWVKESQEVNIRKGTKRSPDGRWNVDFVARIESDPDPATSGYDVRIDSFDSPCFWLEIKRFDKMQ